MYIIARKVLNKTEFIVKLRTMSINREYIIHSVLNQTLVICIKVLNKEYNIVFKL